MKWRYYLGKKPDAEGFLTVFEGHPEGCPGSNAVTTASTETGDELWQAIVSLSATLGVPEKMFDIEADEDGVLCIAVELAP